MDRKIDQWTRIDSRSEVTYIWSIDFNRTFKIILRKTVFSTDDAKTTGYAYGEKLHPMAYLTVYIKVNSKWAKDLNVETNNLKYLDENTRNFLCSETANISQKKN